MVIIAWGGGLKIDFTLKQSCGENLLISVLPQFIALVGC